MNASLSVHQAYEINLPALFAIAESDFETIGEFARTNCHVKKVIIAFIDADYKWHCTNGGKLMLEPFKQGGFLDAVLGNNGLVEIEDVQKSPLFERHQSMAAFFGICFFAGIAVTDHQGNAVGVLAICDDQPKTLTGEQKYALTGSAVRLYAVLNNIVTEKKANILMRVSKTGKRGKRKLAEAANEELKPGIINNLSGQLNNMLALADMMTDSSFKEESKTNLVMFKRSAAALKEHIKDLAGIIQRMDGSRQRKNRLSSVHKIHLSAS